MTKRYGVVLVAVLVSSCAIAIRQEAIEKAQKEDSPIAITHISPSVPNSAGGVDAYIRFVNISEHIIKYVVIEAAPYNRVGDLAPSEIGGATRTRLRSTGPYERDEGNAGSYWQNVWYNHSISCIEVKRIDIEFMNGENGTLTKSELDNILPKNVENNCSAE
jgi:hypothetical protein